MDSSTVSKTITLITILNALLCLCEGNYGSGNGMNDECHISNEPGPGSTCPGTSIQGKCFGISKYIHIPREVKSIFDKVNSVAKQGF